ncbi:DNA-3-methyladenine glycosylase [Actinacidiphila bryophytorum]|uniref:DNA-3-methyladenine glycosylase n=1 Tax=Actinacidiphila bryophytorum TaxID=1436133 RepID=A0A9W4E265_9ACTN|nr:DNA-3-methyladenine glycosylase [Actinacidiphila bryophytorum]
MGPVHARLRGLPRPGVGQARPRRRRALRAGVPGGLPVRPVLDHDPAPPGDLQGGLQGLRDRRGGGLHRRGPGTAARRSRHHPQQGQGRRVDRERRRRAGAAGRGRPGRSRLVLRPRPGHPPRPPHHRRRPPDVPGVRGPCQGPQVPRLPLRRPDHGLRPDAGLRPRQRPPGRLLSPLRAA